MLGGIAAAAVLGTLAWRIGLAEIAAQLDNLRVVLPIVLLAGLGRLFLQTRAWSIALRAEGIAVSQSRLVAVRLASQATGYLAALGPIVSEPTKIVLLRNPGGAAAAAPATLVETGTYWFTSAVLGLAGTAAAALLVTNTKALWAAAALFGVALALLASRRSLLSPLLRAAGRRAPGWLQSAELAENRIRSFRARRPQAAASVLALDSVAQLVTLAEVAAVLWVVGIRASVLEVLAIEAAGRVVKVVAAWIPGRIGADEGGAAGSFALLGMPPAAGLMLAVARRVRDVILCAAGIALAAGAGTRQAAATAVPSQASLCMEER